MLALERRRFRHGLLVLDFEGCGTHLPSGIALEAELDQRLSAEWKGSAKSIVIEPEVDVWMWGTDGLVEAALEWPAGKGVRDWLRDQGFAFVSKGKPVRPKEALETALRATGVPRSSALYQAIAERISLRRCHDEAFNRLRHQLIKWFPQGG